MFWTLANANYRTTKLCAFKEGFVELKQLGEALGIDTLGFEIIIKS